MKELHIVFNIDYKEKNGQVSFFRESIVKQIRDNMIEVPTFNQFKTLVKRLKECNCYIWVHPSLGSELVSKGHVSQITEVVVPELDSMKIEYKKITRTRNVRSTDDVFDTSKMTKLIKELKPYKVSELNKIINESESLEKIEEIKYSHKKVLIITATALESKSFFTSFEKKSEAKPISIKKITYWDFGYFGNSHLLMVKTSDMGSNKPSGSGLMIKDCIDIINPDYIIMVGIAYGLNKEKQKIGQILVSRELENYESAKIIEGGTIQRGHRIPAGTTLLNRFDNSAIKYNEEKVELGYLISGDKLVDSKDFVEKLKVNFPEALGGEMEGTGLQSTCHRENKEWILIKGICDWGFDKQNANKNNDQILAINNVCNYLFYTLNNFNF